MRYRLEVSTVKQLKESLSLRQPEYIYTPEHLLSAQSVSVPSADKDRVVAVLQVFIGGNETKVQSRLRALKRMGYTRVLAHTIGHIPLIKHAGMTVHGGFRLNITNSVSMKQYEDLGLVDSILSIEMSLRRVKTLKSTIERGIIAYGKLPMMLLRRTPPCSELIDRKGKLLPIIRSGSGNGEAELLNPVPLILSDKIGGEPPAGVDFAVLRLSPNDSPRKVLDMYLKAVTPPENTFTRGFYYK